MSSKIWRRSLKNHTCTLGLGSDSMLPRTEENISLKRKLKKLTLISQHHPITEKTFYSYPAMVAERQRQLMEGGAWVIHPYSLFNLFWCSFMVFINMAVVLAAPFRYTYMLPKYPPENTICDQILSNLQGFCILDIIIKLNTGYHPSNETNIVMDRRRIICHYFLTWFIPDLMGSFPIYALVSFMQPSYRYQLFLFLTPCVRISRFYTAVKDFQIFTKLLHINYLWRTALCQILLLVVIMHFSSCLLYFPAITFYYWYGVPPKGYCMFINSDFDIDVSKRYQKAFLVITTTLFGNGYSLFYSNKAEEIIVNAVVILVGKVFILYTIIVMLKIYLVYFDSALRYQELVNQVEKYMRQKQFPMHLALRVRDFYEYRYQRKYFMERFVLDCLSDELRNEIFLDTCYKLIDKVKLFEDLPAAVVGSVLGCLKQEIYMTNDLITKAGEVGNCMYFIACGTVAVYSLKGAEVCHLEDGDHFGEIALLMKDRKRLATIVAIEITQVYRLEARDFREFIMTYHEMYQRVEEQASKRVHETLLLDEAHKNSKID